MKNIPRGRKEEFLIKHHHTYSWCLYERASENSSTMHATTARHLRHIKLDFLKKTTNSMWYHTRSAYINARENNIAFSVQSDQWTRVVLTLKKLSVLHELVREIRRRIVVFLFKQFVQQKVPLWVEKSRTREVMTRKFHTIFQILIGLALLITFCFCRKPKFTCIWTTSTKLRHLNSIS